MHIWRDDIACPDSSSVIVRVVITVDLKLELYDIFLCIGIHKNRNFTLFYVIFSYSHKQKTEFFKIFKGYPLGFRNPYPLKYMKFHYFMFFVGVQNFLYKI